MSGTRRKRRDSAYHDLEKMIDGLDEFAKIVLVIFLAVPILFLWVMGFTLFERDSGGF